MADAGVTVRTADPELAGERDGIVAGLAGAGIPRALADGDPGLWGPDAAAEAATRLGWLQAPDRSRPLLPELARLRAVLADDGVRHVVLAGMGGSSLASEVITRTSGVELTVLDTTDPGQVRAALADRLADTVLVVSSKSGTTLETDSHRRAFAAAFRAAGLDPASRIVVVTDPGSPLEKLARDEGYRAVFTADPEVGGRYSALTAFGLVPSALAGVDVERLLDQAVRLVPRLADGTDNPALALGAALGGGWRVGRDKVVLAAADAGPVGFGDWAEQLLAESTGKAGVGLLPVVVESVRAPGFGPGPDTHRILLGASDPLPAADTAVAGPLGATFLAWEYATAVAGRVIGIDPFDQPNVAESKENTNTVLAEAGDGPLPAGEPLFTDGAVSVYADRDTVGTAGTVRAVLDALLDAVPDRGYLAVMAYLDRIHDAPAAGLRAALAGRSTRPVTFGWGPRFLHSTGQYHKGGPPVGVYLQLTGAVAADLDVPGRPFSFGRLQLAQAIGDRTALDRRSRPTVRLHLTDRPGGLRQLLAAAGR